MRASLLNTTSKLSAAKGGAGFDPLKGDLVGKAPALAWEGAFEHRGLHVDRDQAGEPRCAGQQEFRASRAAADVGHAPAGRIDALGNVPDFRGPPGERKPFPRIVCGRSMK